MGPRLKAFAAREPIAPRLRLVDDESAAEWVAHVVAEANRRERNRQIKIEFAIVFGVLAVGLGAFLYFMNRGG
jgi:small neutral amino acid transporter SnatA (MarC family)